MYRGDQPVSHGFYEHWHVFSSRVIPRQLGGIEHGEHVIAIHSDNWHAIPVSPWKTTTGSVYTRVRKLQNAPIGSSENIIHA